MTLTCAIIDDEPLAVDLIAGYVQKTSFLKLTGCYNSAITAMKDLRTTPVDLIFLDIQMPELGGIEFAKILPEKTKIIFTTAFSHYAIEGYKVNASDYLLKPISYEDFLQSVCRILKTINNSNKENSADRFIFVKSDYKLQQIMLDDIMYIEGLKDYIRIYLANGNRIMSLMNMKRLEAFLPYPEFMRTHRSYIVHMPMIKTIDRLRIVFGETYIPISDTYKDEVLTYVEQHTLV